MPPLTQSFTYRIYITHYTDAKQIQFKCFHTFFSMLFHTAQTHIDKCSNLVSNTPDFVTPWRGGHDLLTNNLLTFYISYNRSTLEIDSHFHEILEQMCIPETQPRGNTAAVCNRFRIVPFRLYITHTLTATSKFEWVKRCSRADGNAKHMLRFRLGPYLKHSRETHHRNLTISAKIVISISRS